MHISYIGILIILILFFSIIFWLKKSEKNKYNRLIKLKEEEHTLRKMELIRYEERLSQSLKEKEYLIETWNTEKKEIKGQLLAEQKYVTELIREIENKNAFYAAEKNKLAMQQVELAEMKTKLNKEFELIATKILEDKTNRFTQTNVNSLEQILSPFKENIKAFEDKIEKVYKFESDERNTLKGVINLLVEQSKQIQDEAQNLTKALKGDNKMQGNWGEMILEKILNRSGLTKDSEYSVQKSYVNEEGKRLQPDVIVHLPDNKNIIIDAKVSLIAYERFINLDNENESEKRIFSKQHMDSIKAHINNLTSKNYADLYGINSPDFVLLFIPIESSFSLTVSIDTDIFNYAWERQVVLVSPSTLFATLRTIASIWKQERQNRNVIEIAHQAGLLYDKFVGFTEDFSRIERQIIALSKTHEDARKKLDSGKGNIISRFQKLKKLGAKTNKSIDEQFISSADG